MSFLFSDPHGARSSNGGVQLASGQGTIEDIGRGEGGSPEKIDDTRLRIDIRPSRPSEGLEPAWGAPPDTSALEGKTNAEMTDMLRAAGIQNPEEVLRHGRRNVAAMLETSKPYRRGLGEKLFIGISRQLPEKANDPIYPIGGIK